MIKFPTKTQLACSLILSLLATSLSTAQTGAVVSGSPESTEIGIAVLEQGGTAADSAVAVSLALGVAEPYGSGLGGKIAILYYDAASGKVSYIDGMIESPSDFPIKTYADLSTDERKRSYRAVCIPGLVAGLDKLHSQFGRLSWKELVAPAAKLARDGFVLTEHDAAIFKRSRSSLRDNPETKAQYLIDNEVPTVGTRLKNADLAHTLDTLAEAGPESFYRGAIAELLVAAMEANGGWITLQDLRNYKAIEKPPLQIDWLNFEVFSSPSPTTGGGTVLLALKALEAFPDDDAELTEAERFNRIGYALSAAYGEYTAFGDTPGWEKRQEKVFSKSSIKSLQATMLEQYAKDSKSWAKQGSAPDANPEASTTHFVVVDAAGNVASITQSLGNRFGAFAIAPGTGFLLNNGMYNFAINSPSSHNYIAESKRPRSTIAPTLILENGKPRLVIGSPAGQRIPPSIVQVASEVFMADKGLDAAITAPRFHLRRAIYRDDAKNYIEVENTMDSSIVESLDSYGWDVHLVDPDRYYFGGVNAILITEDGQVEAVADPRRSNTACIADE